MLPNWFDDIAAKYFEKNLQELKNKNISVLQIGAYTGDATEWLINNLNINSIEDVDTWEGSDEDAHKDIDFSEVLKVYQDRFAYQYAVYPYKMTSDEFFKQTPVKEMYDFIYIDGDHTAAQTLKDGINSFELLKVDGVMAFDDYGWHYGKDKYHEPKLGIDAFLKVYLDRISILDLGYQAWIRKIK